MAVQSIGCAFPESLQRYDVKINQRRNTGSEEHGVHLFTLDISKTLLSAVWGAQYSCPNAKNMMLPLMRSPRIPSRHPYRILSHIYHFRSFDSGRLTPI